MVKTLTTSEVARYLGVAPGSIVNWIKQGELKAGRTPGGHRRVVVEDLIEFLRRQQLPIPTELTPSAPKILVVDDETAVAELIAGQIRQQRPDYEVRQAHDGFTAGDLVGSWRPDVVLLDLRMPGMDGYEVCRRIKAKEETKSMTVIAVTAYYSPDANKEIVKCGARACFTKPVDCTALLQEIEASLQR